ncbi:MAG TPA: DUF4157 domain-containing protein [Lysobacter sp.]
MRFAKESRAATPSKPGKSPRAGIANERAAAPPGSNRSRVAALNALSIGKPVGRSGPSLGATGTPHEHEADRWANHVNSSQIASRANAGVPGALAPLRPSPWSDALHAQWGSGAPLDAGIRRELEQRAGADLGPVRVHHNEAVGDASTRLGAQAWTLGTDVFLGAGAPALDTPDGTRLLAHEMAHVLQQSQSSGLAPGLSSAPYQVQRQPAPPVAAAPPAFSVNQATYLGLINTALGTMGGRLVQTETLATTVEPILRALVGNPVWKDAQGNTSGGGAIQHTVGSTTLNLTLTLNDDPNPLQPAGRFSHGTSMTTAGIEVFIQKNTTAEELAETLYHEAMHLVSWLVNRPTSALGVRPVGRAGPSGAVATLDLARSTTQIASVRLWLDTLAQSVNPRRATGAQISAADLDRMASWLVEEINVRVETEVFRQAEETQRLMNTRGPLVYVTPGPNWQINTAMVDRYVFDFSRVFLPTDRAGLTAADQQALATLMQILEGIFQSRVRRRFNRTPYLMGRGLPRAQVQWSPPPLTPPTFRPLPLP